MTESAIDACPTCDDSSIARNSTIDAECADYRCVACGELFDEPVTRPAKGGTGHANGLAKELLDADADEVSAGD